MSRQEQLDALEAERVEIETAIAEIKSQVATAKASVISDGVYSDPHWFARAQAAMRFKGIRHQQILREIAALRRAVKQEQHASGQLVFERAFIDAARRRLTSEMFRELIEE